jgi:hypothetical protein
VDRTEDFDMVEPSCRLYVIVARDGRSATIFRRGPTTHTRLIRWWLRDDTFDEGQWIRASIYPRRADLSPDGEYLIYFAGRFRQPLKTWTAISHPPYFTALALWPKTDTWGGGGSFHSRTSFSLHHPSWERTLKDGFSLPKFMQIVPHRESIEGGKDLPNESPRLIRDGWQLVQRGRHMWKPNAKIRVTIDPPKILARPSPLDGDLVLLCVQHGRSMSQGKTDLEDFQVVEKGKDVVRYFESIDWADWDRNGDLLIAEAGRVYRLPAKRVAKFHRDSWDDARLLADFSAQRFTEVAPPAWALKW